MIILLFFGFIFSIISRANCNYEYHPEANGWLKVHSVSATWQQAFVQCNNEGAVLASPINTGLLAAMNRLASNHGLTSYYIGTHSRLSPRKFVSLEGVPLEQMPISSQLPLLILGQCMNMYGSQASVISCFLLLPYMCYMKRDNGKQLPECGTFDREYHLDSTTGSCYKVHRNLQTWPEAYATCVDKGGYLAILNNEQEALVVKNLIPDITLNYWLLWDKSWDPFYIGLRDWTGTGSGPWVSIHGEPIDQLYSRWHVGQPDCFGQLCGALLRDGTLDNAWCHIKSFSICEKNPINTQLTVSDPTPTITTQIVPNSDEIF